MLSLWALYSIIVEDGRLRTLLKVSLILLVTPWSQALLFQMLRMSSWNLMDTTAPQTSSPTMNCSPNMASTRFSQHLDARPEKKDANFNFILFNLELLMTFSECQVFQLQRKYQCEHWRWHWTVDTNINKTKTRLDFRYVKPSFDKLQFSYNFMKKKDFEI